MTKNKGKFWLQIRNDFLTGIAVLLPGVGTILIVTFLLAKVNNIVLEPVLVTVSPAVQWADRHMIAFAMKGVILIVILCGIIVLGLLVKNFFIQRLLRFGEGILLRVPFVNKIYSVIQQISGTFFDQKKDIFNKVVMLEYPRKGVFILGLMTTACVGKIAEALPAECVNIFVPTTPNPTSGFLIMVPRNDVIELTISVEDAMKLIVSGGVVTPQSQAAYMREKKDLP